MQYAIGIDLGGTNIAAGIVDETYAQIAQESIPTGASRPWQDVAADMAALALRLCGTCGLEQEDCAGHRRGQSGHMRFGIGPCRLFQQPGLGACAAGR